MKELRLLVFAWFDDRQTLFVLSVRNDGDGTDTACRSLAEEEANSLEVHVRSLGMKSGRDHHVERPTLKDFSARVEMTETVWILASRSLAEGEAKSLEVYIRSLGTKSGKGPHIECLTLRDLFGSCRNDEDGPDTACRSLAE